MKKLFLWLLKLYSQTERERIEILRVLDKQIQVEYSEQTPPGNVYNYFIEFVMANPYIVQCVREGNVTMLNIMRSAFPVEFEEALRFINEDHGL